MYFVILDARLLEIAIASCWGRKNAKYLNYRYCGPQKVYGALGDIF
jgi:hypothetical protein